MKRSNANSQTVDVQDELIATLGPMTPRQKLLATCLVIISGWGWIAYAYQARVGLAATAMTDYFSWGIYIINFVFFIGISMAGTLISAILRLTGATWRAPVTRLAEAITLFSLLIAGPMIIIDMGRPDRFFYVLLHGRIQSPILWDVLSLTTYMAGSILYLYLPMIPDMAILRDHPGKFPAWRRRLYSVMALGWKGTQKQHAALERAIFVMAIVILPVAVSIHTVTAWLFGMTLRPGWHTTIIGPDFVIGALYSGVAAVITAIAIFRHFFNLQRHLSMSHFLKLANLLLVFGLVYGYFIVNEHVGSIYTNQGAEQRLDQSTFAGPYRLEFWGMVVVGMVIPLVMLVIPKFRSVGGIVCASLLVNVGMWLKRYIIVVPTLATPFMPAVTPGGKALNYVPTWVEWSVTIGAFSGFSLMYLLFAKLFPIISIWELKEEEDAAGKQSVTPSSGTAASVIRAGLAGGALLAVLGVLVTGASASAAEPTAILATSPSQVPASQPAGKVALAVVTEDGQKLIRATVTQAGKPLESAAVEFSVRRSFGSLKLGNDTTLDDGTAAVKFPTGLPGNSAGELSLIAEVKTPPNLAGACAEIVSSGGTITPPDPDPFPRSLWSPRAPLPLLVVVFGLVVAVWSTYAYIVFQIVAIRKGAEA